MKLWVVYILSYSGEYGHTYFISKENADLYYEDLKIHNKYETSCLDEIETED